MFAARLRRSDADEPVPDGRLPAIWAEPPVVAGLEADTLSDFKCLRGETIAAAVHESTDTPGHIARTYAGVLFASSLRTFVYSLR